MLKKVALIASTFVLSAALLTSCSALEHSESIQTESVSTTATVYVEETIFVPTSTPTPSPTFTPTPSPTPAPLTTVELYEVLDGIPSSDVLQVQAFGGYTPSSEILDQLYEVMAEFDAYYYDYSFTLIDIRTGRGISYNPDQIFYPASSIKGPFALSLADLNPDAAVTYNNTITNMLVNSDNDAYALLNNTFGRQYIQQWFADCNIVSSYANYKYPRLSSRDVAKLWVHGYDFLMNNELGPTAMEWLNHPNQSVIYSVLGEMYETYSKAGWMLGEEPSYNASVDAGIVMSDVGPYVIVIQSNIPDNLDRLSNLVLVLEQIHQEMYN